MDIEYIREFVVLAETRNFNETAELIPFMQEGRCELVFTWDAPDVEEEDMALVQENIPSSPSNLRLSAGFHCFI